MRSLSDAVLDLLFPPRCAICAKSGIRGVCPRCESALPYTDRPLRTGAFGRCAVPLRYEGAVRDALLRFKFQGGRSAAVGFGALLARCAAEELSGEFDLVTYVPVSEQRRRSRGYDQAKLLAVEAAARWDTKPVALLRKVRDNPAQSGLESAAQRRENVRNVYAAQNEDVLRSRRILLIDDILTTGATLSAAAEALLRAGAAGVVCAAVAVADKPEPTE